MQIIALRLSPQQDLKQTLLNYCTEQKIEAACIVSCVGSLQCAAIRLAGQSEGSVYEQKLEITSLSGTLSRHGMHLHIAVADERGQMIGGHLMDDSIIRTTAEIVLGVLPDVIFLREIDPITGYKELQIKQK
jgi:predicted DNA-binding protein with PD1-like motif